MQGRIFRRAGGLSISFAKGLTIQGLLRYILYDAARRKRTVRSQINRPVGEGSACRIAGDFHHTAVSGDGTGAVFSTSIGIRPVVRAMYMTAQRQVNQAGFDHFPNRLFAEKTMPGSQQRVIFENRIVIDQDSWPFMRHFTLLLQPLGITPGEKSPGAEQIGRAAGIDQQEVASRVLPENR